MFLNTVFQKKKDHMKDTKIYKRMKKIFSCCYPLFFSFYSPMNKHFFGILCFSWNHYSFSTSKKKTGKAFSEK
ncbi:hypothetical protein STCU_10390 [Strigomonas culicis]|uniref:Uncharacterized protein n=1 Tax=Strigomonas culicis TaxID=28005 RepID=S9UTC4_9TRYP|nr:hypothetical protein STCU_10390 [Strigomonas culicis]|eukprot:EPY17816.1 hypothetical protein STCU_10390 [Strigomonas culicis]